MGSIVLKQTNGCLKTKDSRFDPAIDKKTGYTTKNMLTMPIKSEEEVVGTSTVAYLR